MKNIDVRMIVSGNGLTYKEIAAAMGVSACHLSRLLAGELQPMTKKRILCAISNCIEARREGTDAGQAAIDALDGYIPDETTDLHGNSDREILEQLLAVQLQRKTGKWIGYNIEQDGWKRTDGSPVFMSCSECNEVVLNNGSAHWNFCPNCGSYNGGAE